MERRVLVSGAGSGIGRAIAERIEHDRGRVLALEGAEHGVSASAICPGYVRTPIVESQIEAQSRATGVPAERVVEDVLLAPQAVKRILEPEEVAETAAFLLGPGGRAFTGAPVVMDLGWTARGSPPFCSH